MQEERCTISLLVCASPCVSFPVCMHPPPPSLLGFFFYFCELRDEAICSRLGRAQICAPLWLPLYFCRCSNVKIAPSFRSASDRLSWLALQGQLAVVSLRTHSAQPFSMPFSSHSAWAFCVLGEHHNLKNVLIHKHRLLSFTIVNHSFFLLCLTGVLYASHSNMYFMQSFTHVTWK